MGKRSGADGHPTPRARPGIRPPRGAALTRRQWVGLAAGGAATLTGLAWFGGIGYGARAGSIPLTMYASAGCECCHKWVAHLEAHEFRVATTFLSDVAPQKDALGVPAALRSCHTAEVGGYVVEGHVPADVLRRFLAERPADRGLAAPGMPSGSPGMEDAPRKPFDVIAFTTDGNTRVYARA